MPNLLIFHNDPLTMKGSKSVSERKYLLEKCSKIYFVNTWSRGKIL